MARIRSIKPEFFTDLTVAGWKLSTRVTFIGLWTYVDDSGRGVDDARLVKAAVWPLDDSMTTAKVESDLRTIAQAGKIERYEVNGAAYLRVCNWSHQKISHPTPSRFPPPPDELRSGSGKSPEHVQSDAGADPEDSGASPPRARPRTPADQGTGNREQGYNPPCSPPPAEATDEPGDSVPPSRAADDDETSTELATGPPGLDEIPRPKRGCRLPERWTVSDAMRAWAAQEAPGVDVDRATAKFGDYWRAKSGANATKLDWHATWRNWIRTEAERSRPTANGKTAGGRWPTHSEGLLAENPEVAEILERRFAERQERQA